MKLESILSQPQLIIAHGMGNNPKAKSLALLVQAAFIEELDWNMELNHKDGFIYGEFKQENGKPHGDILVFIDDRTIYDIDDTVMFKHHTIPEIMAAHPAGFFHNLEGTPEWARKFVREFH
jgi:hypothetical protein